MLKAAEFPDLYNPTNDQSLESLLQQKNKKLESDLVQMRNGNRDLQSQLKKMAANLDELQKKNAETEKIIARYEDSAAIAAMPGDNNSIKSASTEHVTLPSADSIVVVLTNQRDRLKKQNNELEERLATINKQLDSQKQESNRLQADNVKLFERIKYIEAFANKKTPAKENVDTELGDLLPYQNIYEERLDPFRLFFQNEVVKRFKSLGKTDRTVWKLGRVFLTNKFIRRFMVTYFALLHIILLYMLLRSPSTAAVVVTKH
jgi:homeobox protein cut-like